MRGARNKDRPVKSARRSLCSGDPRRLFRVLSNDLDCHAHPLLSSSVPPWRVHGVGASRIAGIPSCAVFVPRVGGAADAIESPLSKDDAIAQAGSLSGEKGRICAAVEINARIGSGVEVSGNDRLLCRFGMAAFVDVSAPARAY